ncbi:helical backbone metal receptor [Amycolatopsis aidingensis]|uniref:helical backbone metal receptor n=1 Tax=Amycolatopsis aidingensis TaxID=2842453 RepID=UPI001E48EDF5|nr:helical backbone metal receptor [Amycolatopsis aidingensis]
MARERTELDDMSLEVRLPRQVRRVVSLVPSLTDALAATDRQLLAGATTWCTHPPDLEVERVRGTKNPDVRRIIELAPDLVLLNKEENRKLDHQRLTQAGIPAWVTVVEDVDSALRALDRLCTVALDRQVPDWLAAANRQLGGPVPDPVTDAVICVWRDPWMVVGSNNFATDLLRRLGVRNVYAGHSGRYPRMPLADIQAAGAELVILPDEPYPFSAEDGPAEFPGNARVVDGRRLTWYGPSLVDAKQVLGEQLGLIGKGA